MTYRRSRSYSDGFTFTETNKAKAQSILNRYPEGKGASALMPILDLAQRQNGGWISKDVIAYVSTYLSLPEIRVLEVASFYSQFHLKPVGTYHIQVCGTPPCWLCGSQDLMKVCQQWLGIKPGDRTADGKFSLQEVECLGACTKAPVIQINDQYHEKLNKEKLIAILEALSEGKKVSPGGSHA